MYLWDLLPLLFNEFVQKEVAREGRSNPPVFSLSIKLQWRREERWDCFSTDQSLRRFIEEIYQNQLSVEEKHQFRDSFILPLSQ